MAVGTYLKAALSISIFLAAVSVAAASPPTEAQPDFPADGGVIAGETVEYLGEDYIWTRLVFIPGATAVEHTGYFSEDYSKVDSRDPCAFLGHPPYASILGWEYTYFAGNPQVPPANQTLVRGTVYYWTVDETDAQGNTFAGDIWEFAVQGYYAFEPSPPNEAVDVGTTVQLSWFPGVIDIAHAVHLGTSWDDVNDSFYSSINPPPELLAVTTEPNILLTGLEFNTKYYWRVDECVARCPPPLCCAINYKGDVWSFTTEPRRIFVDVDAGGVNNGASWENAYKFLQDALIDANSSLKPVEIWVAEGIYTPDSNSADPNGSGDRAATFQLINGVTLKGGYAGFGEANPNARDIELYETILSGDLDGNDVDVNDPCDLRDEPTRDENSYHVVTGSGTDPTAALNGVIVTGGNADGYSPPICFGGGMYNEYGSPTVINCTFNGNFSHNGGGMYNYSSSSTLTNCIFSNNSAGDGGGMLNDQSNITLINCTFSGNSANIYAGGGMYDSHSDSTVVNCTFSQNSSRSIGGGMQGAFSEPTLTNCILWGNVSDRGSQIAMKYGSIVAVSYCNVQGGISGVYLYNGSIDWRDGNIDADPCFVDAAGGDLRLSSDSPCIDAGYNNAPNLPPTDFDGHPRIIDGDCNDTEVVDMGAYEFNYAYMGDFDYNCRVNFADLSIFGLAWTSQPGDFNWDFACNISIPADNVINKLDLAAFADNWLAGF